MGCGTHEKQCGYDVTETGCLKCGGPAYREAVYLSQSIQGETCPKGSASRAGNLKDQKGRYRVSLFQEAGQEAKYARSKE